MLMKRRVAARGIIEKDGQILAVQLKQYKASLVLDNPYWCIPGGGVDEGEPLLQAVEREVIEELGIKPVVGNLLFVQQFMHLGNEQMEFFFHIKNTTDYLNIDLSRTTHGLEEIDKLEFITPSEHNLLPKFLQTEDIDPNSPVKFFNYS